jgi:hypothetical protein
MDLAEVFSRLDRDFRDSKKNFQKKISKKNFQKKNSKFFLGLNPSAINLGSACKQKMGGGGSRPAGLGGDQANSIS